MNKSNTLICLEKTDKKHRYKTICSLYHLPFISDHRITASITVLPASYILSLLLTCLDDIADTNFEIEEMAYKKALILRVATEYSIEVELHYQDDGTLSCNIYSQTTGTDFSDQQRNLLASATAKPIAAQKKHNAIDLTKLLNNTFPTSLGDQLYQQLKKHNFNFGPAHQGVEQIWYIDDINAIAKIKNKINNQESNLKVNPTTLDACSHVALALITKTVQAGNEVYLTTLQQSINLNIPLPDEFYCAAKLNKDNKTADLTIIDQTGNIIGKCKGYTLKKLDFQRYLNVIYDDIRSHLYNIEWNDISNYLPDKTGNAIKPSNYIVIGNSPLAKVLSEELQRAGSLAQLYPSNISSSEKNFIKFICEINIPTSIILLFDNNYLKLMQSKNLLSNITKECSILLNLLKTANKLKNSPIKNLIIITQNVLADSTQTTNINVISSTLQGYVKSIASEYHDIRCLHIDTPSFIKNTTQTSQTIIECLQNQNSKDQISIRYPKVSVPKLKHFDNTENLQKTNDLDTKASYLISGGFGNLGMIFALWLSMHGAKHLILIGRHKPSAAHTATLKYIKNLGTTIYPVYCDIAEFNQLQTNLQKLKSIPPLKGIIHAAGVSEAKLIQYQTQKDMQRIFRPKIQGAWNLHQLSLNYKIDFFISLSSVAAHIGLSGASNYAAANAFLSGLSSYRKSLNLPTTNIAFGPIASGMYQSLTEAQKTYWINLGFSVFTIDEMLTVVEYMLLTAYHDAVAMKIDWPAHMANYSQDNLPALLTDFYTGGKLQPAGELLNSIQTSEPNKAKELLTEFLSMLIKEKLKVKSVDIHRALSDYGIDSQAAVVIKNELQSALNLQLPVTLLFNYPTIAQVVGHLVTQIRKPTEIKPEHLALNDSTNNQELTKLNEDELLDILDKEINKTNLPTEKHHDFKEKSQ